jgi:uncharacterized DUF497 family protein
MIDDVVYREKYIWHQQKNERNQKKHGIRFEEAVDVFDDPFAVEEYDDENSVAENRYNITGHVHGRWLVVTVTFTSRTELIRIISARNADTLEQGAYDENVKYIQAE